MRGTGWWALPATLILLAAGPGPALGQASADSSAAVRPDSVGTDPDPGARVTAIRLDPDPLEVRMGDTVLVRGVAVDSAGAAVPQALWGATDGATFQIEPGDLDGPAQTFRLWGHEVGEGALGLFVASFQDPGQPRWRRIGEAPVTVTDYPVASVDVEPLPASPYVGTVVPATARVLNTEGRRHASATAAWTSSDTTRATVDADGRVRFLAPGPVELVATAEGLEGRLALDVRPSPVRSVILPEPPGRARTGDVLALAATLHDGDGRRVTDAAVRYSVEPADVGAGVFDDGAFVAERPGWYRVTAAVGTVESSVEVEVFDRDVGQGSSLVAHVPTVRATDLWVFEGLDGRDYAYTGTLTNATMYAVDVTDPAAPVMTDSVTVDGRRVNDVKVNDDRTVAVITSENASNRQNGITLLDLADPAHPTVLSHYTTNLTGGVHNVWFVGDLVYAVNDGTLDVHIIDISDRTSPVEVGRWGLDRRGKYLHDVSVVDGLAYLSYWDDGVVILDVGAGIAGGTPVEPRFVSSYKYRYDVNGQMYGNTHHAFRYGDYLFLGDEIFGCPGCVGPRGYIHVLDVSDVENPVEVAWYRVPEAGSHNMWIEDDRLYVGYYQGGLRVVDVSGELRGDLLAQGREIARFETTETGAGTMAWGPQPYKGHVFVSDMNTGLWIVRIEPKAVLP